MTTSNTTTSTAFDTVTSIPDFLTITPIKPATRLNSVKKMSTTEVRHRQFPSPEQVQPKPPPPPAQTPSSSRGNKFHIELPKEPLPKVLEPLFLQIGFFLHLWAFKILGTLWLRYHHTFHPQPKHTEPDQIKTYPVRPHLPVDIFYPPTHRPQTKSQSSPPSSLTPTQTLLPLYIDIHGGGLCLGTSTLDHTFSRSWSTRTTSLVASLNYTKTPASPFPRASHDIATLASAVINDPTLPIDKSRITIGGFSAGGLLSLSATQLPPLKGQVHNLVAYYPATDFSEYPAIKFGRRLDTSRSWEILNSLGGALDWGYVDPGQDRRDPVLSPLYADAEDLPRNVCVVAAQYDMFCREGRDLVFKLAGREVDGSNNGEGEGGWKDGFEIEVAGGRKYKWVYASGEAHGFTEVVGQKPGRGFERRKKYCEELYQDVHQWLEKTAL